MKTMTKRSGWLLMWCLVSLNAQADSLLDYPLTTVLIEQLVTEHGFDRQATLALFADGNYVKRNVENLAKPAEQTKSYQQYKPMFVSDKTIEQGLAFMAEQAVWLDKAEQKTGVSPAVIAAIIGIESRFGNYLGVHRTFDALATLAVTEGRRAAYFQRELIQFLRIARDQGFDPLSVKGSYAGAMGYPQFMPTSYVAYAVDLDENGQIDIWQNPIDAIGSVAHYLAEHGWQRQAPIISGVRLSQGFETVPVNRLKAEQTLSELALQGWQPLIDHQDTRLYPIRLDGEDGPEYWLGFSNFWVISRYNRSVVYSMAVTQLAQRLANYAEETE